MGANFHYFYMVIPQVKVLYPQIFQLISIEVLVTCILLSMPSVYWDLHDREVSHARST